MIAADNLLNMTQDFMTPDFVQKFSHALGQPAEKIQSGLKAIVPTFLMGLVSKGTTNEGAEGLVNMAQQQNLQGPEVVLGIFGNNLSSVASTLESTTGMKSANVTKLMAMIAPVVMGALGSKIKNENMSAPGLMYFLSQQKSALSRFIPSGITGFFGGSTEPKISENLNRSTTDFSDINTYSSTAGVIPTKTTSRPWGLMALVAFAILAAIWFFGSRRSADVISTTGIIPTTLTTPSTGITETATSTAMIEPGQTLSSLNAFLNSGSISELPKRFRFENLNFKTGETILVAGAEGELDQIAGAMKEHPMATARLEGFTDNTGDMALNTQLSMRRAEAVKQELINRGVEANRLQAVGLASVTPIAPNNTEAGRAQNRRIEFVVTGIR